MKLAVFTLISQGVLIVALQLHTLQTIEAYHAEAVSSRQHMLGMEAHNEQMLLEHMRRTVERWEALQKANPQLNVKQIPEPIK